MFLPIPGRVCGRGQLGSGMALGQEVGKGKMVE